MATKKGMLDKAMESEPAKVVKGVLNRAVDAVMNPPLAPEMPVRAAPPRAAKKAPTKKAAGKKAAAKKMDRKLVSTMEDYEVKYLAQKHGVSQKAVKAAVAQVGHSRNKVEAELKRSKAS